jgi:hypothetical protein
VNGKLGQRISARLARQIGTIQNTATQESKPGHGHRHMTSSLLCLWVGLGLCLSIRGVDEVKTGFTSLLSGFWPFLYHARACHRVLLLVADRRQYSRKHTPRTGNRRMYLPFIALTASTRGAVHSETGPPRPRSCWHCPFLLALPVPVCGLSSVLASALMRSCAHYPCARACIHDRAGAMINAH